MLTILKYSSRVLDIFQPILLLLGVEKRGLVGLYTFVYGTLLGYSDQIIKLLVAQSALETSWFASEVFVQNNNAFGMRQPTTRETVATGSNLNHATYSGIAGSVIDRFLYDDYFNYPKSGTIQYFSRLLSAGYATAGNYTNTIQAILNTSTKRIDEIYSEAYRAAIYLGALISVGGFFIWKYLK